MKKMRILLTIAGLIAYSLLIQSPASAENQQFAVEYTNQQAEWNLDHSAASVSQISHINSLATIMNNQPQSENTQDTVDDRTKVYVKDKSGKVIAIKTLNSSGTVVDVEFISHVDNIDRDGSSNIKYADGEDLMFMENIQTEDPLASLDI